MRDATLLHSKILIIDDEPDVVEFFRRILQSDGYSAIQGTTSPFAAARLFGEFQPDLVVLDLIMPGRSGLEVLAELRAMTPAETYLPILVITGDPKIETRREALRQGASDFVTKPFDTIEILARIENLLKTLFLGRMKAEVARQESEDTLFRAFEHAPIGVALVLPNGRWLKVNRALCDIVGYSEAELVARTFMDISHRDDLEGNLENQRRMLAGETDAYQAEKRYLHARGHVVTALLNVSLIRDQQGHPRCFITQIQDITARKQAEAARDRLAAILESTTDVVSISDPNGRLVYLNLAGRNLLGVGLDEDISTTRIADFIPDPASHPIFTEGIPTAVRQGTWSGESVLLSRRGQEIPVSQVILAHKSPDGKLESLSTIMRDITAQKLAKLEIQSLNADLERRVAQRTEELFAVSQEAEHANRAKSEFLSRTSHELRTPLNAIFGFGHLLETEENLGGETRESIEQILHSARRLLTLIDAVLDISDADSGRATLAMEPVAVGRLVEDALSLARPLGAALRIELELPTTPDSRWRALANPHRLKQVLFNLLSNAVKYNHPGGKVTLECAPVEVADPPMFRFSVKDTGPGISAGNLARLFAPFDRLDAERTRSHIAGTGLGLALSKRMIELMGGRIGVESILGEGSTFWIEVPLAERSLEQFDPRAQPFILNAPTETPGSKTLLYLEDSLSDLRLIKRIAARRPAIRLLSAGTMALGWEMACEHRPALILLDLHLPATDGGEVLARFRADPRTSEIPVVMLSADELPGQREQMLAAGARAFHTKPVEVRTLLGVLDQFIGFQTEVAG